MNKIFIVLISLVLIFGSLTFVDANKKKTIILATTTSTDNSGLLSYINPFFEKETGITVKIIALGTGAAVKTAEEGNADIILVHARKLEDKFVSDGYGVKRYSVMYNDFIIIGPKKDPATIKDEKDVAKALKLISDKKSIFVSRGDNSGTHIKEQFLWQESGISLINKKTKIMKKGKKRIFKSYNPDGKWYMSIGQGMGSTINFANEKQGYTITDRGTFLAYKKRIELKILSEGDKRLFNPYGIIAVNPKKHPHTKIEYAEKYIKWITSKKIQTIIGNFKIEGKTLFFPNAGK